MDERNTAMQNSSSGFWMKKKRYEDDDMCISPPSDETGFLSLKFGIHQTKPQPSMFDRINQELGFTTKDSSIETNTRSNYTSGENYSASLKYGSGGIFLESKSSSLASNQSGPVITVESQDGTDSPNIVMPSAFLGYPVTMDDSDEKVTENEETLICKSHLGSRRRKIYKNVEDTPEGKQLLENIQNLDLMFPENAISLNKASSNDQNSVAHIESSSESLNSSESLKTCQSGERRRRRSSVPSDLNKLLIEQSVQNAFFTGSLFSSSSSSKISTTGFPDAKNTLIGSNASHVALSVPNVNQLAVQPSVADNQDFNLIKKAFLFNHSTKLEGPNQETGTVEAQYFKKRPKASHLREMNIWSPQSM